MKECSDDPRIEITIEQLDGFFFRHPFILLLLGSVISSYLLPWILSQAAKDESTRKEKLGLAFEILNRNFNSLLVSLELFHKYSSSQYLHEEQKELRKNSRELYQKFNTDVWWWHWDLYARAKIWKLLPQSEDPQVVKALDRYSQSWTKVTQTLPFFWHACLDPHYRIHDSKVTRFMDDARSAFDTSMVVRDSVIRYVVSKFDIEQISTLK